MNMLEACEHQRNNETMHFDKRKSKGRKQSNPKSIVAFFVRNIASWIPEEVWS